MLDMKDAITILMPIYLASMALCFFVYLRYRRQLRALYPDLAATLYPNMVPRNPITNLISGGKSWRFVMRREYRSLDNRGFVRLCDCCRVLIFWCYFAFAVLVIVGFTSR
jgi:hypothetical protein